MAKKKKYFTWKEAFDMFLTPVDFRGRYPAIADKCHLCGKKASSMRGIAIVDNIKVKNAQGEKPTVDKCCGPEHFMYLCPRCHHHVWSMFFELWDATANGPIKYLLSDSFDIVKEIAKERYKKALKEELTKGSK